MNHWRRRAVAITATVAAAMLLTGCGADDAPAETGVSVSTQSSAGQGATTTDGVTDDTVAATDGGDTDTVEDADDESDNEQLPEPEWAAIEFRLEPVAETDRALAMAVRSGSDDFWIAERDGRVRVIQQGGGDELVLDISDKVGTDGEGGLLGIDFSPNGLLLYVSYTDRGGTSVIAEYEMTGAVAVADTERVLLRLEQPFSNHNGGQITFGPDGFLYIGFGDGGSGGDPLGNGQDLSTILGAVLRIDPSVRSADSPYGVPDDNPFVGQSDAREEIWLYGVRNPWRFSFDAATGDLWIGDVGQGEAEEIDFLEAAGQEGAGRGANLGWNFLEGDLTFSGETPPAGLVAPIATYGHDQGRCSVTGGYVYRGERIAELAGVYVFGDFCSGEIFGLRRFDDGRIIQAPVAVGREVRQIVSFGQGADNELYVLEGDGTISRLATDR